MSKSVEFFFDVGSPATYLAYTQLPLLCARTGSELIYRPMLLGGVFKATGNASPVTVPAKGAHLAKDLDRFAKRYGVPFTLPPLFPDQHAVIDARRDRHATASAGTLQAVHRLPVPRPVGRCP